MKELTLDDMQNIDKNLSDIEEHLRNSQLDDECYLINYIRSFLKLKFNRGQNDR